MAKTSYSALSQHSHQYVVTQVRVMPIITQHGLSTIKTIY